MGPLDAKTLDSLSRRFRHGFAELWEAFRAVRGDRIAWRRYLRVCIAQALVTVAAAGVSLSTARRSSEDLREERVRKALARVQQVEASKPGVATGSGPGRSAGSQEPVTAATAPVPRTRSRAPPATHPAPAVKTEDEDGDDDEALEMDEDDAAREADSGTKLQKAAGALGAAIAELGKEADTTAVRRDPEFQEARRKLDRELTALERSARKMPLTDDQRAQLIRLGAELDVLEQRTRPGFWDSALALFLSIYGTLSLVQAAVIALSRDYHAAIARDASLLLGVAPEDPPLVPRVRINVRWIRRKLKQRTRSLMVFLPGTALLALLALPFPHRATLTSVLTAGWAAYWWVVWTASKSARAWEREGVARPPWFLRLWHRYLAPLPVLGWLARGLERLWSRLTRAVFSPAEAVEAQPAEFAGLAAARALQLVPVLKLFVRPLVPVAAARLMAERAPRAELLASREEHAALTAQRAALPVSAGALRARDEV